MRFWAISLAVLFTASAFAYERSALEEAADARAAAGDYEAARTQYKKALRDAVRRADGEEIRRFRKRLASLPARFDSIRRLIAEENYEEAFKRLKAYLNLNPGHPTALSLMGVVYESIGQDAQAERLHRKAVSAAPKNPGSHFYLGRFYLLKKKKFERALEELKMFRELMREQIGLPENAPHKEQLEKEWIQATRWIASIEGTTLGRPERAFAELESLVRAGRADAETLYDYGLWAARLGRRRTAYDVFQKIIREFPKTEPAQKAEEAIEYLRAM